ncbi:MAG TPA: glycosyltransferase [Candidatus Paceibacterota bacterium]|nr:glycosyltransferase [Candidatus Paceibacterota bacterium]
MTTASHHPFWKRYYYSYLESFLGFLVPVGSQVYTVEPSTTAPHRAMFPTSQYEYIVASDVLGNTPDIVEFLQSARRALTDDGRVVLTQYSALWEPILRLATTLGWRRAVVEQNWLSMYDLYNFSHLAGFDVVKSGKKMLIPIYIPLISTFFNTVVANIWPFTHFCLFHYAVLRKAQRPGLIKNPSFSIIVPARNEAGTIEKIVTELSNVGAYTEIVFVEGNSTDNTYAEIERVAAKYGTKRKIIYAKQTGKGKGDAVRKGFDLATGDILSIYDADMTVPAGEMQKFYEALVADKGDFINGSRLVYPLEKDSMRVLNFFANKFFSLAFSWILGQPLKDTLCGTKVLWKRDYVRIQAGRSFFGDFDPFGDFDLLFGAAKLNLKIIDLPIHYQERVYGATNISRWKHGWLLLKMTLFAARKIKFI